MGETPQEAQALFIREIATELHRKTELCLYRDRPGALDFGYVVEPSGDIFTRRLSGARPRRLKGYRIRVAFERDSDGTRVRIRGRCERYICEALELLGRPGHWPQARET